MTVEHSAPGLPIPYYINIKINTKYYLLVVQVYATTSTHTDEEVGSFYEVISKILSENKSYYKMVTGDFNAKVGGHQQGDGAAVRQYGYGEETREGRTRLVPFAKSENLTISEKEYEVDVEESNGLVKLRLATSWPKIRALWK